MLNNRFICGSIKTVLILHSNMDDYKKLLDQIQDKNNLESFVYSQREFVFNQEFLLSF